MGGGISWNAGVAMIWEIEPSKGFVEKSSPSATASRR
jgi:hypothetical protein